MLLNWSWCTIFVENTFCYAWKDKNHRVDSIVLWRVGVVKYAKSKKKLIKICMKVYINCWRGWGRWVFISKFQKTVEILKVMKKSQESEGRKREMKEGSLLVLFFSVTLGSMKTSFQAFNITFHESFLSTFEFQKQINDKFAIKVVQTKRSASLNTFLCRFSFLSLLKCRE